MTTNKIKQPEPQFAQVEQQTTQAAQTTQKRVYNAPKVGVVSPPKISTTPLADTLEINKQENPRIKYKYRTSKKYDLINVQNVLTGAIGILGIGSLISLFKKHK